jgi:hypothetical protein
MPIAVKILLPAALLISTTVGSVVAYSSWFHRSQNVAPVAAMKKDPATPPQPSKDDALKGDSSWARWPSVTDINLYQGLRIPAPTTFATPGTSSASRWMVPQHCSSWFAEPAPTRPHVSRS